MTAPARSLLSPSWLQVSGMTQMPASVVRRKRSLMRSAVPAAGTRTRSNLEGAGARLGVDTSRSGRSLATLNTRSRHCASPPQIAVRHGRRGARPGKPHA